VVSGEEATTVDMVEIDGAADERERRERKGFRREEELRIYRRERCLEKGSPLELGFWTFQV